MSGLIIGVFLEGNRFDFKHDLMAYLDKASEGMSIWTQVSHTRLKTWLGLQGLMLCPRKLINQKSLLIWMWPGFISSV